MDKRTRLDLLSKSAVFCIVLLLLCIYSVAQPRAYGENIKAADSLYSEGDYMSSAKHFSKAFESFGWKGSSEHRYNAAKSWAMSDIADSAFYNLFAISERLMFSDIKAIQTEAAFNSLHDDPRWKSLIKIVETNATNKINFDIVKDSLEQIFLVDQQMRSELENIYKEHGLGSRKFENKVNEIKSIDSLHTEFVCRLLDQYGWLSEIEVGRTASTALFIIILHSPLKVQMKYQPLLKEAFSNKKINPHNYSLLEDKISLANYGFQIYGTQITADQDGKSVVQPIKDKANVNIRRKQLGLEPLEDYLKHHGIENY